MRLGAVCLVVGIAPWGCSGVGAESSSSSAAASGGSSSGGGTSSSVASSSTGTSSSSGDTGGTGSSTSSSSGGGVTSEQACADYAQAFCGAYQECTPWLLAYRWGDLATCLARVSLVCPQGFTAPGSAITPDLVQGCTNVFSSLTCAQLATGITPVACRYPDGTRGNGEPCTFSHQCASGVCRVSGTALCGVCAAAAQEGEDCNTDSDCAEGLACNGAFCVVPVARDGECGAVDICLGGLVCDHGFCEPPKQLDDICNPDASLCDARQGLYCNPATNRCQEIELVDDGDLCGVMPNTYRVCQTAGLCIFPENSEVGECTGHAADAATCDDDNGPRCLAPAFCFNGVCTLPDAQQCQ
ncbi:MAG: hypothetical protein AB2A00_35760 [Myxococcota bacterium]